MGTLLKPGVGGRAGAMAVCQDPEEPPGGSVGVDCLEGAVGGEGRASGVWRLQHEEGEVT